MGRMNYTSLRKAMIRGDFTFEDLRHLDPLQTTASHRQHLMNLGADSLAWQVAIYNKLSSNQSTLRLIYPPKGLLYLVSSTQAVAMLWDGTFRVNGSDSRLEALLKRSEQVVFIRNFGLAPRTTTQIDEEDRLPLPPQR